MFTGIVECATAVVEKTDTGLVLARPAAFDDLALGNSIATSGVCLSLVEFTEKTMRYDVVPETWARTNLGDLTVGDTVNVERSVRADGRLEGHIVQGHIEGTAETISLLQDGRWVTLKLRMPAALLPYVVKKGGIALDGVSLTVADVEGDIVSIALIPHTLQVTTLGLLTPGKRVNVETDIVGRYVRSFLDGTHTSPYAAV